MGRDVIKRIVVFRFVEVFVRTKLVAIRFSCCARTEELHRQENKWLLITQFTL